VNNARCCRNNECVADPDCSCRGCELHTSIEDDYNTQLINQYSLHVGIINFFPVMFGLLTDPSHVKHSFRVMADEGNMLGQGGLRSLSKTDQFYLFASNYWRGAVWINVNYLVLRGLFQNYLQVGDFSAAEGEESFGKPGLVQASKQLYDTIRLRLIRSVYQNWKTNHLFWEQYDNESGKGLYTHPFNGWTSLILLIVSENYV